MKRTISFLLCLLLLVGFVPLREANAADITHTVTFVTNGGSTIEPMVVNDGENILRPNNPTRGDWTFYGWCTDSALTTFYDFTAPVRGDLTLYARWSSNVGATAYDATNGSTRSGGKVSINDRAYGNSQGDNIVEGDSATLKATADEGYKFVKWVKDFPYGETVSTNATFSFTPVEGYVYYYAIFEILSYTVTVTDDGNGTASASPTSGVSGTVVTLTATPNSGYRFKEWSVISDVVTVADNKFTIGTTDVQVEAIFELIPTCTVTFDSNGGSAVPDQTVEKNKTATRPADPTDAGFTFVNWYTDEALTTVYDFSTPVTADITLYAKWKSGPYTLTFDPNGGTGSYGPITVDAEEGYILPHPADIGITAPAGKEFYMWDIGGTFTAPADGTKTYFGKDTTLKALWEEASVTTYTVYFDTDFATTGVAPIAQQVVTAGQKATKPADPTRTDWTFDAWCSDKARTTTFDWNTPITADITLYARWSSYVVANAYDATNEKVMQGGTVSINDSAYGKSQGDWIIEGASATLTAKANDGYHFVKWVKDSPSGTTVSTKASFSATFTGEVTYYAVFEVGAPAAYTVTVTNDGNGTASASPASGATGTNVTLTATPNSGYKFKEWQVVSGGVTVSGNKFTIGSANVKIKAVFEKKETTTSPDTPDPATVKKVQAKKTVKLKAPKVKKAKYQWYVRANESAAWKSLGKKGRKQTLSVKATTAKNGYQYRCQVKTGTGETYSDIYELYVYTQLKIKKQPKWGKARKVGSRVTLTIKATGADSYQWMTRPNGSAAWTPIDGATGTKYVVNVEAGMAGRQFACRVTGRQGTRMSKAAKVKLAKGK